MKTITPFDRARTPAASQPISSVVLALTVAAAATEAILLRAATRTLIYIPGIDRFEAPIRTIAEASRLAYYLAAVLLIGLLVALARRQPGSSRSAAVTTAIVLFMAAAAATRLGLVGNLPMALAALAAVAILIAPAMRAGASRRRSMPIAALSAAFLLAGLHTVAQLSAGSGWPLWGSTSRLLLAAEVLAVLGALTTPSLVTQAGRVPAAAAATVGIMSFAALAASGEAIRILMLWNLGLGGWLPDLVYAGAAASFAYTAVAAWRSGRHKLTLALLLLVCGGIGLHSTYQSGLVIAGLAVLALSTDSDGTGHVHTRGWPEAAVPRFVLRGELHEMGSPPTSQTSPS